MGDNLYTASLVALDADTGKLKWHYQFTPHDLHDWDSNHVPVLADITIGGRAAQGGDGGQPQRLLLHARPRHRRAAGRQALHHDGVGAGDRQGRQAHRAQRRRHPAGRRRRRPRRACPICAAAPSSTRRPTTRRCSCSTSMARETCAYYTPTKQDVPRAGRRVHERRHAEAGDARLGRAARHRSAHRRAQVGVQVRAVVAGRRDVHGVGPGVRRRPGRRLRRLRRQDRQAAVVVPHRLADLGRAPPTPTCWTASSTC